MRANSANFMFLHSYQCHREVKSMKLSDNKSRSFLLIVCKFGAHILSRSKAFSVFVETHRQNMRKHMKNGKIASIFQ